MPLSPTLAEGHAMLLAGIRRVHRYQDVARDIPAQWAEFVPTIASLPTIRPDVTYGVICGGDAARGEFEYMTGVEVSSFDALPEGTGRMRVPAARYAVFTHDGPAATIRQTWDAIHREWLPATTLQPAGTPDFERYDSRYDPATASGIMEIWFPVLATR